MIVWNKAIYRFLLLTSFIGVNALILFGISQMLLYLNTGADRSSMLHLSVNEGDIYVPKVTWLDSVNPGRKAEEQILEEIQQGYLKAWRVRNIAYQTCDLLGISDFYTQSARTNLVNHLTSNKEKEITIEGTTIKHNLKLDFYSADGQLVAFTDTDVKEYQRVYKNDKFLMETKLTSTYKVIMLLEDGFWKIRHIVKERNIMSQDTLKEATNDLVQIRDNKIYVGGKQFQIKGINYYPQKSPWDMFGDNFNAEIISQDFKIIKNAGLNTIRVFIPYEDFGKATVKLEKLLKLKELLDQAELKNLKVVVTLFDFYGDYAVQDWTFTHRHAEQIVTAFRDHKAILAWDIKNEPNLDFESRKKENVLAWLKEMITQVKNNDPNHLVTIGWSDMKSAHVLEKEVDVVSFHYYLNINSFAESYDALHSEIKKPLVLQEFGLSSSRGLWSPFGASEKGQAAYYKTAQQIMGDRNIHFMSWTLYDFEEIPTAVVGRLPWRKHKQKYFGFIDHKGNKKPAFEHIKE